MGIFFLRKILRRRFGGKAEKSEDEPAMLSENRKEKNTWDNVRRVAGVLSGTDHGTHSGAAKPSLAPGPIYTWILRNGTVMRVLSHGSPK